ICSYTKKKKNLILSKYWGLLALFCNDIWNRIATTYTGPLLLIIPHYFDTLPIISSTLILPCSIDSQ
ncbi:MAG: hypothetical protein AAF392_01550, partial [Bacteroidota bacterium]